MQSRCLGLLLVLVTPAAMAQSNWLGDVLVQRLPNGDAYAEVQLAWQSDASTAYDSLTVTLVATRDQRSSASTRTKSWPAQLWRIP